MAIQIAMSKVFIVPFRHTSSRFHVSRMWYFCDKSHHVGTEVYSCAAYTRVCAQIELLSIQPCRHESRFVYVMYLLLSRSVLFWKRSWYILFVQISADVAQYAHVNTGIFLICPKLYCIDWVIGRLVRSSLQRSASRACRFSVVLTSTSILSDPLTNNPGPSSPGLSLSNP